MKVEQLIQEYGSLKKFFVDLEGEIYSTNELHEKLARDICEAHNWKWREEAGIVSAEEYLMHRKGFIKVSNYDNRAFRYIALSKDYMRNKHVMDNAEFISSIFNLRIEIY